MTHEERTILKLAAGIRGRLAKGKSSPAKAASSRRNLELARQRRQQQKAGNAS